MNLLQLYHGLPYPLRTVAASARGYRLRLQRFSQETERLVEEALERDRWSVWRWKQWQEERLSHILRRALTSVPYYRDHWRERRLRGDRSSWELLKNWPILKKETVRKYPKAFLDEHANPRKMIHVHTSGTTGKPISIWRSRKMERAWYALHEARCLVWNGVSRLDRCAVLGGQLVTPFRQSRSPFWVWNQGLRQLYMSSYHLSKSHIPNYIDALRSHRVVYMEGYPSSMYAVALTAVADGIKTPSLRMVLSYAEPLVDHQRQIIGKAFGCPIRNTYGMAETVCGASECEAGSLHLWPEVGLVETDHPLGSDGLDGDGRFICTGLLNDDMPLIRYEVGDCGMLETGRTVCPCGRTLPLLARIEGRLDEVLVTADGRHVGRLDPVFKADLPIREAQIVQESLSRIVVKIVATSEFDRRCELTVIRRLKDRVGDMEIEVELVDSIPRTANGKFRAVLNRIPRP